MGKKLFFGRHLLAALCLSSILASKAAAAPKPQDGATKNLVQLKNVKDAESKDGTWHEGNGDNAVDSDINFNLLMMILCEGARGETLKECEKLFKGSTTPLAVTTPFCRKPHSGLEGTLRDFSVVVYSTKDVSLQKQFELAGELSYATFPKIDFTQTAKAAEEMRSWVQESTDDLIEVPIKKDQILIDSKVMVMDAVLQEVPFVQPFDVKETKEGDFYISKEKKIKVQLMTQTNEFQYAKTERFKVLAMTLGEERNLNVLIALPEKTDSSEKIIFHNENLCSMVYEKRTIKISVPKFRVESDIAITDILKKKIPSGFDSHANFSGISETPLKLLSVDQTAMFRVHEEGIEAAAITGAALGDSEAQDMTFKRRDLTANKLGSKMMYPRSGEAAENRTPKQGPGAYLEELEEFVVDRPFLFALCHSREKEMSNFHGEIAEPHFH